MDRWLIVTADGELELNATFHAVNLLPGDVDTNALWRQPGQRAYQRSGDGLRTPGPFILRGNVWRDDGDRDALRTQLQALTEAATTAATVVRLTPSAEYWYGSLGGGPNPAITPDGLGGYQVELEFWPARPEPVTVPPSQFRARVSQRVPSSTYFAEVFTAPGPVMLNNPGSIIADLLGRNWALIVDRASGIVRMSGEGSDGEWIDTLVPGHPVIGSPTPGGARRFSLAFDQAANPVVAFEHAGAVKVTRWDASLGQYVQNVSFAGVDPVVFMDAMVLDAASSPLPVFVEWNPTGQWLGESQLLADSDVVVFYLSGDRQQVAARIQRDLFLTEYVLWSFGQPVILDRVVTADGRYQLLVSAADGSALPDALQSGPYVGGMAVQASHADGVAAGVQLEPVAVQSNTFATVPVEGVAAGVQLEAVRIAQNIYLCVPDAEQLVAGVALEAVRVASSVYVHAPAPEGLTVGVQLETVENRVNTIMTEPDPDGITAGVALEAIRVQSIS